MTTIERIGNASNQHQGPHRRVLCVCHGGLLRSPTAAEVLSQAPYYYNTRSCGTNPSYALIPLDVVLLKWADEIVVMEDDMEAEVTRRLANVSFRPKTPPRVLNLRIPDRYAFRDPELIELIRQRYRMVSK